MTTSLRHQFLVAMPSLEEAYFNGALCYLCEHNDEGAFGIVVNKPTGEQLSLVYEQLELSGSAHADRPVLMGGPVQEDRGFILHTADRTFTSTVEVTESLRLSTGRDALAEIAAGDGPEKFLLALGYAGWAAGQLESEMGENAWLNCPGDESILFDTPLHDRVRIATAALGIDFRLLGSQPGHA